MNDKQRKAMFAKKKLLTNSDLLIEPSPVIKDMIKHYDYKDIAKLTNDLDVELLKMMKMNGKTEREAYDAGIIRAVRNEGDPFYDPNYRYNFTDTILKLQQARKVIEHRAFDIVKANMKNKTAS